MARKKDQSSAYDQSAPDQTLTGPQPNKERAQTWWDGLTTEEKDEQRSKFEDGYNPTDKELVDAYAETHSGEPTPEQQHTGDEPPVEQAASPGASATNPELMKNDPPDGTPLYDRPTLPPGMPVMTPLKEGEDPQVAYAYARGEPLDEHQAALREKEAKDKEERDKLNDRRAREKAQRDQDFKTDEAERVKAREVRQNTEYVTP